MSQRSLVCLLSLILLPFASQAWAQEEADLVAGKEKFVKECANCHGPMEDDAVSGWIPDQDSLLVPVIMPPQGPKLKGMYGRTAGTVVDYVYTQAFLRAFEGVVWDEESLNKLIRNSQKAAPGSNMDYKQANRSTRRNIIAYMKANQ